MPEITPKKQTARYGDILIHMTPTRDGWFIWTAAYGPIGDVASVSSCFVPDRNHAMKPEDLIPEEPRD